LKVRRAQKIRTKAIPLVFEKFRKIRSKRSGADRGTVKFLKLEFQPILLNYRPNSPISHQLFPKIGLAIPRRILAETSRILQKIGHWKEKTVKNNCMTSTKFVHANSP
jgi:hypothetical protein